MSSGLVTTGESVDGNLASREDQVDDLVCGWRVGVLECLLEDSVGKRRDRRAGGLGPE